MAGGASVHGWPSAPASTPSQGQKLSTGHEPCTRNTGCSGTQRRSPTGRWPAAQPQGEGGPLSESRHASVALHEVITERGGQA